MPSSQIKRLKWILSLLCSSTHSTWTRATTHEINVNTMQRHFNQNRRNVRTDWNRENEKKTEIKYTLERTPNTMRQQRIRFLYFIKWKVNFPGNPNATRRTTPYMNELIRNEMEYNEQCSHWRGRLCSRRVYCDNIVNSRQFPFFIFSAHSMRECVRHVKWKSWFFCTDDIKR